jgi:hypothetical protein
MAPKGKNKPTNTTDKSATVPKPTKGASTPNKAPKKPAQLPKGLLNGRDDDPLVATAKVLQHFVGALQGQTQHNVATTTTLRDHRLTLEDHGEQLKSNGDTVTSINTRVKSNTESITYQNRTLESHAKSIETITQNVETLTTDTEKATKAMEDKITANATTLQSHKTWQDSFAKLNGLLMSSNEKNVLALKGRCAILEQRQIGHDERLDNHAVALETLGKKADTQETVIETNRAGVISNAEAINAMAVELEETDERLNRIEATQEHQQNIHEVFADTCQKMEGLFHELFVKTKELNTEIEKEKYDPEELNAELLPPQQASSKKNRRMLRKRNRELVPIPATYKKSKLTEDNKWTLVQTEAASAATRAALYAAEKDSAAKRVEEANKALADHESEEERRREEAKEQEEEEERRRAEEREQKEEEEKRQAEEREQKEEEERRQAEEREQEEAKRRQEEETEEETELDVLGESNPPTVVTPN